jgi:hypothetical protein
VSQLYDMKLRVEEKIKVDHLEAAQVYGKLGLKTGMLMSLINASTPDNPEKIAKFKSAAMEVLGLAL